MSADGYSVQLGYSLIRKYLRYYKVLVDKEEINIRWDQLIHYDVFQYMPIIIISSEWENMKSLILYDEKGENEHIF